MYVALLRGINVGGRTSIPMAELRALCAGLGWTDVASYVQSGNLVFGAAGGAASAGALEAALEDAVERRFGFSPAVAVRTAGEWRAFVRGNPFPDESRTEPNLVMLALSKAPPAEGAAAGLAERATAGERVVRVGDALWIHYAGGAGRSKLSPGLLDRIVGSPVTTRNWRTVLAIDRLFEGTA
jgi:uncharacterized protein (DUF1697 family)